MSRIYKDIIFDFVDDGARISARRIIETMMPWLEPRSVLDIGCGRGVWLSEWDVAGVDRYLGVDSFPHEKVRLSITGDRYLSADLTKPVRTHDRFDLAQSLEVAEHLPEGAAEAHVASLVRGSDRVLFSAAVVGQGGEAHVNEQPLHYWQSLFALHGYAAFDCLRPELAHKREVEPWFRYNTILYVNEAGRAGLPDDVLATEVPMTEKLENGGDMFWRMRRGIVQHLPQGVVTQIAQTRAAILARAAQRHIRAEV